MKKKLSLRVKHMQPGDEILAVGTFVSVGDRGRGVSSFLYKDASGSFRAGHGSEEYEWYVEREVEEDLEEFRVHSTVDPEFYIDFFEKKGHLVVDMYNPFSGDHYMTVDKDDLKAVVEKL